MYEILHSVINFLKPNSTNIDNLTFKLHYKLTSFLLVTCSILISCNQFFGDPINCFTAFKDEVPEKVLDNYCWIHSTFTLPEALNHRLGLGVDVVAPGVSKYLPGKERTFHQYYQWVCFFLFFQAMTFYVPRFLWKTCLEGGKMRQIVQDLKNPMLKMDEKDIKVKQLACYFVDNVGNQRGYAFSYFLCEALNFVNVVGQILITDAFLGGEFTTYGLDVLSFIQMDQEERTDPMVAVFPRVSKCTFNKFGPSGDIQRHDALCILSLNILNEKVFVAIWFWFIALSILTGAQLVYRFVWIFTERLRYKEMAQFNRKADRGQLLRMNHKFTASDWFLLHLISKNVNSLNFRDFVNEVDRLCGCNGMVSSEYKKESEQLLDRV